MTVFLQNKYGKIFKKNCMVFKKNKLIKLKAWHILFFYVKLYKILKKQVLLIISKEWEILFDEFPRPLFPFVGPVGFREMVRKR